MHFYLKLLNFNIDMLYYFIEYVKPSFICWFGSLEKQFVQS